MYLKSLNQVCHTNIWCLDTTNGMTNCPKTKYKCKYGRKPFPNYLHWIIYIICGDISIYLERNFILFFTQKIDNWKITSHSSGKLVSVKRREEREKVKDNDEKEFIDLTFFILGRTNVPESNIPNYVACHNHLHISCRKKSHSSYPSWNYPCNILRS